MHPYVLGAIVGSIGATAFVMANRNHLPAPWPTVALWAWLAALVFCLWLVLLRPRILPTPEPPSRHAGPVYGGCILGMVGVMAAGMATLNAVGHPQLEPSVVVIAVGLHFVPFAFAFGARIFATMGAGLALIGAVGLLLGLVVDEAAAAAAAVLTGLVMLVLMGLDADRDDVR